jgi:hypothetical protein
MRTGGVGRFWPRQRLTAVQGITLALQMPLQAAILPSKANPRAGSLGKIHSGKHWKTRNLREIQANVKKARQKRFLLLRVLLSLPKHRLTEAKQ